MAKQTVGPFTELVGRRIASRRKAKKITPEELAKKIGVSLTVLDHMEHGLCHINLEQMIALERLLGPMDDLLGLPHVSGLDMAEYLDKKIRALSEEQLRAWKADAAPLNEDRHRLYVLDLDSEGT